MRCAAEVNHFHSVRIETFDYPAFFPLVIAILPVWLANGIDEHDVFWLQIGVNQTELLQL